jgi:phosphopantetheine--protein transferase-like protein
MKLPSAFLTRIAAAHPFPTLAAARSATTTAAASFSNQRSHSSSSPSSASLSSQATTTATTAEAAVGGVFGIGVDVAHIPRFDRVYERQGMRFLRKCLHPKEIAQVQRLEAEAAQGAPATSVPAASPSSSLPNDAASVPALSSSSISAARPSSSVPFSVSSFLASRWSAKEALTKAAGKRLLFPDMHVQRDSAAGAADPRARLVLSGAAAQWSAEQGLQSAALLSLSHDGEYAVAFVALQTKSEQTQATSADAEADGNAGA